MKEYRYTIFYGNGCPVCEEVRLLMAIEAGRRGFTYREREVWDDEAGYQEIVGLVGSAVEVPLMYDHVTGSWWRGENEVSEWLDSTLQ